MRISELFEIRLERIAFAGRHLYPGQHAAIIRAVIAVMEQGYVPVEPQPFEEFEQRAGAFGKLETVEQFVCQSLDPSADHIADMELGDLVVGHVEHMMSGIAQR